MRTTASTQIVFLDTPGIHKPRTLLGERTQRAARSRRSAEVDVVCLLVEANARDRSRRPVRRRPRRARSRTPTILVVNKIDAREPRRRSPSTSAGAPAELGDFDAFVPLSARTGDGVDALVGELEARLPEGPHYYPDGVVSDQPETFLAAELLREKLLAVARDELPHSIAVTDRGARGATTTERADPLLAVRRGRPRRAGLAEGDRDRQGRRGAPRRRHRGPPRARGAARRPGSTSRPTCRSSPTGSAAPTRSTASGSESRRGSPRISITELRCANRPADRVAAATVRSTVPRTHDPAALGRTQGRGMRIPTDRDRLRRGAVIGARRRSSRSPCSPRCGGNDNGQNSLDPHGPGGRDRSSTCSSRSSGSSRSSSASASSAATIFVALRFRDEPGEARQPEADPRQHRARDRLDDRPGADPRGDGRAHRRRRSSTSPRSRRAPTSCRSRSSASSGGGSSSTRSRRDDKTVVTANEMHIPVGRRRWTSRRRPTTSSTRSGSPSSNGKKDVVPGPRRTTSRSRPTSPARSSASAPSTAASPTPTCGSASSRRPRTTTKAWVAAAAGARPQPWTRRDRTSSTDDQVRAARTATSFDDASKANVRPEPHPPRRPHDVRRRHLRDEPREPHELGARRAVAWSRCSRRTVDCRRRPRCVGMPSFTKNTPKGQPDDDARATPSTIVDYLLGEK